MLIPSTLRFLEIADPDELQRLIDDWSDKADKALAISDLARAADRQATNRLAQAKRDLDSEGVALAYHRWLVTRHDWRRSHRCHWER